MTPEDVKSWADALTAPVALVCVIIAIWRSGRYFVDHFLTPLGGTDGKIAHFVDTLQTSVSNVPEALHSLEKAFREIGLHNQQLLETMHVQQRLIATELAENTKNMKRICRAGHRACDAVREITRKLHPEHTTIVERHLVEIEHLLDSEDP